MAMYAAMATIAMAYVAWRALDAWKDQNKHEKVFEFHKTLIYVLVSFKSDLFTAVKIINAEAEDKITEYSISRRDFYFKDYPIAPHVTRLDAIIGEDQIPEVVGELSRDVNSLPTVILKAARYKRSKDQQMLNAMVAELEALTEKWSGSPDANGESLPVLLHTELDNMLKKFS